MRSTDNTVFLHLQKAKYGAEITVAASTGSGPVIAGSIDGSAAAPDDTLEDRCVVHDKKLGFDPNRAAVYLWSSKDPQFLHDLLYGLFSVNRFRS